MQRFVATGLAGLGLASCLVAARAADLAVACTGCTGPAPAGPCVPACQAEWHEEKTKKPKYSMKCEYACARAHDSWHAPPPECRCRPPCGNVYVKKRLYKAEGPEKVERVPKYEVQMVPAEPCDCRTCRGGGPLCWPNPFALFH